LSTATNGTSWNLGILDIQTGPDGTPIKWFINIDQSGGVGDPTEMRTRNTGTTGTTQIDLTQYRQPDDPPGVIQQGIASVSLAPGSWTVGLPGGGGETLTCNGFDAPMNKSTPVRVRKNRVLPLRATLTNDQGQLVDDLGISAPPLVVVEFDDGLGGDSVDVSDDALPGAFGTAGNQFEFVNGKWVFNLVNENYSAPGTYTASMVSGDSSEYTIDPTCSAQFVIRGKKK
jgi:hypothetical protein